MSCKHIARVALHSRVLRVDLRNHVASDVLPINASSVYQLIELFDSLYGQRESVDLACGACGRYDFPNKHLGKHMACGIMYNNPGVAMVSYGIAFAAALGYLYRSSKTLERDCEAASLGRSLHHLGRIYAWHVGRTSTWPIAMENAHEQRRRQNEVDAFWL